MVNIYTDGATSINPGLSGIAFLFVENGRIIYAQSEFIGYATNNEAEYIAVIKALLCAKSKNLSYITLFSDSQLMVRQLTKSWKIHKPELLEFANQVWRLIPYFNFRIVNVSRDNPYIQIADSLNKLYMKPNLLSEVKDFT